jgi:hypothetical protein
MSRKPIATLSMATKEDREMASTNDVVDHHLKCFGERDLKGILFDYAPGAVLFTPDGPQIMDNYVYKSTLSFAASSK